ncbi:hypothetical protein F2Q70_00026086 [Brassica cretica]|uniref:Uncharacterized protein n=1 Tax=Brassica cretica TaxID=69181 RepID=A0A8S9LIJ8_BRACR|nr:hypothetical protein F2Q70_00026086 [Brassica cretica]
MKAGVPWPRKKVKNIRRLRLNVIRAKRQLGQSAPLAHSAVASGSQLISARQTVRVSGRWSRPWAKSRGVGEWVGLVTDPKPNQKGRWGASCREGTTLRRWCPSASKSCLPRQGGERGEPRGGSEGMRWAVAPSDRMDGPCDRTAALSVPNPTDTSLDLAIHNRTASLDTGRLCGWFESHHGLGGWAKRLVMSQKARVAKGHELPKVVSCQRSRVTKGCELPKGVSNQRVQVAKGYEHQEVRGSRGTKDRRGACSKRCLLRQVVSDPYGSVYDLLSQDRPKAGSGKEVCWAIEPDFMDRSHLDSIWNQAKHCRTDQFYSLLRLMLIWLRFQELRMVLVKPRSREVSVSENLCNVWLDDATDELVIVYETVKKLCIGSHVSK